MRRIKDSPERLAKRLARRRGLKQAFAARLSQRLGRSIEPSSVSQWIHRYRRPREEIRPDIEAVAREMLGVGVPADGWPPVGKGAAR